MKSANLFVTITEVCGVPVSVVGTPDLWIDGAARQQLEAVARFDGVVRVAGMPDLHPGRGYPIGAVALVRDAVIPALIDKDIGCGMTFVGIGDTRINPGRLKKDFGKKFFRWDGLVGDGITAECVARPQEWRDRLSSLFPGRSDIIGTFLQKSYGVRNADLSPISGRLVPEFLAESARNVGTIGGGNHFVEFQKIADVVDEGLAAAFGIHTGGTALLIHTGSRSFGYSLAESFLPGAEGDRQGRACWRRALRGIHRRDGRRHKFCRAEPAGCSTPHA